MISCSSSRLTHPAPVIDLSMNKATYYATVVNISKHTQYLGWSNVNQKHAQMQALRHCHSHTAALNVCRLTTQQSDKDVT